MWVERRHKPVLINQVESMTWKDAVKVGFAQCLALIPGTSRSGATIIGGMLFGLSRKTANRILVLPRHPYHVRRHRARIPQIPATVRAHDILMLAVGSVVSFISAFIAVRALLRFVASHNFMAFAWYRIIFGVIVLLTYYFGWIHWAAD